MYEVLQSLYYTTDVADIRRAGPAYSWSWTLVIWMYRYQTRQITQTRDTSVKFGESDISSLKLIQLAPSK